MSNWTRARVWTEECVYSRVRGGRVRVRVRVRLRLGDWSKVRVRVRVRVWTEAGELRNLYVFVRKN